MNAKEFVSCCKKEKDDFLLTYLDKNGTSLVSRKIASLELTPEQEAIMKEVVDGILIDTFYTILLGLDGSASIGGVQQTYKVFDEENNCLSKCGELEAEAYEQFHAG